MLHDAPVFPCGGAQLNASLSRVDARLSSRFLLFVGCAEHVVWRQGLLPVCISALHVGTNLSVGTSPQPTILPCPAAANYY